MTTPTNEAGHGLPERALAAWTGKHRTDAENRAFLAGYETCQSDMNAALALSRGVPEIGSWIEADGPLAAALDTPAAAGAQGEEWRCFYCSEVFTDRESAALHFGSGNIFDHKAAGCQIDLAAYRAMEELVSRYQEEDAPIHRQMHRMAGEHAAALRREEERGYARGLRDSGLCPCSATPQPAAADGGVRELPSVAAFASAMWRDWMTNEQADKLGAELHAWLSAHFATALSSHRQAGDDLSKFRELAERWRTKKTGLSAMGCANELLALVEKGAGS